MEKIVLYLMSSKGLAVLKKCIEKNRKLIDFVVVAKDSNVENDYSDEIASLAMSENIDCYFRGAEPLVDPNRYALAVSWRWMINHPEQRLIIFHDSILPKYRGFAPLVNMLINGESEIGVSAIFGAAEYDKGHIIAQETSSIRHPIAIADAIEINNGNFVRLAERIIMDIELKGELIGTPQDETEATYSIWRNSDDYFIDWEKSAEDLERFILAVGYPYSGAKTTTSDGETIVIFSAEAGDDVFCELRHVGKVIFMEDGSPTVVCGEGVLRITEAYKIIGDEREAYLPMTSFRVRFT